MTTRTMAPRTRSDKKCLPNLRSALYTVLLGRAGAAWEERSALVLKWPVVK